VIAMPQVIQHLPLFPLNAVLFPDGLLPLRIFEQRYLAMMKACLKESTPFGVCLIREGREVGAPALPAEVGCLAEIRDWEMPQLGLFNVVARGTERFRIIAREVRGDGLTLGRVETLGEEVDAPVAPECAGCVEILKAALERLGPQAVEGAPRFESSLWVSARLAELLPLPLAEKQALLEIDSGAERLARLQSLLAGRPR
jgi:Lon protease-like protein